jgi:CheY-like chemotaxis protein
MLKTLVISNDGDLIEALRECAILPSEELDWCPRLPQAQFESNQYNLVVIDSEMEGVDAELLVSEILQSRPEVLILLVAEPDQHELISAALRAGAYDFIARPLVPDYITACLKRVVNAVRLCESNRLKDQLLGDLSHGLRTPLNIILNWAQLLRSDKPDESIVQTAAEMVERNTRQQVQLLERVEGLVRDLSSGLWLSGDPKRWNSLVKQITCKASLPSIQTQPADTSWRERQTTIPLLLQGLKVLVVDDEDDARELLQIMLTQSGAEVQSAASVKQAIAVFQQFGPDILVSDICMPDLDGCALMRHIRSLSAACGGGVKALALTAYSSARESSLAREAGFNACLTKPIDPAHLVQAVAKLAGTVREKTVDASFKQNCA